jgi:hypothetical protein
MVTEHPPIPLLFALTMFNRDRLALAIYPQWLMAQLAEQSL